MAEIVNLRRVKRQKAREEAAQAAAENRIRHGRTGGQKAIERDRLSRERADLDARRLDPGPDGTNGQGGL